MSRVLITGATSGIGKSLAATYLQKNDQVFACGRNEQKLNQLVVESQILGSTDNLHTLTFDITKQEQIEQALNNVDNLDIVILNAGDCEYIDDALHFDNNLFARVINVNLVAIGHLIHHLLAKMNKGAQLVLVSSSVTLLPLPRAQAYGASKAGLDYLANSLRLDLYEHDIGVTLVHPGFVKTPLTDKNDFAMPLMISSEDAANRIYQGVKSKRSYLQFPKRFTYILRLMSMLPNSLWLKLITQSTRR